VKDESWIDKYRAEGGCFEDIGEFREISLLPEVRGRTGFRRIETRDTMKEIKMVPIKSWWPGDSRVEKYMPPVKEAIKRHIQEQSAFTDIYNRCYEAIYKAICDKEK